MQKIENNNPVKYVILVLDLDEAYCAEICNDGQINKIFDITSSVPGKQRSGGQSARRFERIREGCIIEWFKRINEYLTPIKYDINVGVSFVYKERFKKYLSTCNLKKIVKFDKTEYSGLSGIYQFKSKVEKEAENYINMPKEEEQKDL